MFGQRVGAGVGAIARATVVAAVVACAMATGLASVPATAAAAGGVNPQTLVGAWFGPPVTFPGDCGNAWAQYSFSPDATYRYLAIYDNCDPITMDGNYQLQNDGGVLQMSVDLCGQSGCPPGPPAMTMTISQTDQNTVILDSRYTYRRMQG